MGTLSFSKLSPNLLSTTFTPIIASDSPTIKLSQVCLKGKLDLSMWRGGGDEDEEDMEMDSSTELVLSQTGASPQPPPSPLLAPLLAAKKSINSSDDFSSKRPASPITSSSSRVVSTPVLPTSSPVVIQVTHVDNNIRQGGNLVEYTYFLPHYENGEEYERSGERANNSYLGSGTTQGNGLSAQTELRQLGKSFGQVKPQQHQQPQRIPLLLSRLDSSELLKLSQLPSGRERVKSATRKVEFSCRDVKMETHEQLSIALVIAPIVSTASNVTAPSSVSEKPKWGECAKDGSARSRSGSARRPTSKTQDILQEIRKMSLASQDALQEKKKAAAEAASSIPAGKKFGRKLRYKRRKEEEYTDKDRAAAVTLGSKDIKQSLKAKKKRDRKMRLSISFLSGEDYVIGALVGEAGYQMRVKKQPEAALATLNKALEIQPNHKGALVARSQCYLKLGDAESALKDAEQSWDPKDNETYIQGLYQYAEALFQLGEFEKALIAFHRGHRVRKDMDNFRIGIQKSQEAIRRAIGDKSATAIPNLDAVLPLIQELEDTKARLGPDCKEDVVLKNIAKYRLGGDKVSMDSKVKSKLITRELMGQLYLDKSYLKNFINRPEVINQDGLAKGLREEACEALKYLESRESFWRQQNPLYSRKNFTTMLKAHAHDVACRETSLSAEPSIAKFLQRRSSVLTASRTTPTSLFRQTSNSSQRTLPVSSCSELKRRSSEPQLNSHGSKSEEKANVRNVEKNDVLPKMVSGNIRKGNSLSTTREK